MVAGIRWLDANPTWGDAPLTVNLSATPPTQSRNPELNGVRGSSTYRMSSLMTAVYLIAEGGDHVAILSVPAARLGRGTDDGQYGSRHLAAVMAEVSAFNTALQDEGAFLFAGGLNPPSSATTVDVTGPSPVHTPGPFAEAKEYLGGFWIIEAGSDKQAISWAERASKALRSKVEVRALQESPS